MSLFSVMILIRLIIVIYIADAYFCTFFFYYLEVELRKIVYGIEYDT